MERRETLEEEVPIKLRKLVVYGEKTMKSNLPGNLDGV